MSQPNLFLTSVGNTSAFFDRKVCFCVLGLSWEIFPLPLPLSHTCSHLKSMERPVLCLFPPPPLLCLPRVCVLSPSLSFEMRLVSACYCAKRNVMTLYSTLNRPCLHYVCDMTLQGHCSVSKVCHLDPYCPVSLWLGHKLWRPTSVCDLPARIYCRFFIYKHIYIFNWLCTVCFPLCPYPGFKQKRKEALIHQFVGGD